ncbi:ABC transporter permease [Kutzneria buriramensis]|uniref:Autoinducer 2 import system permease protein LsrD n=1 Tax=Kutzneria buriramensis TaxID=1045776 RepID=A0A3E0GXJ2_9PSEU|nr:ABC transporter permease [Kutzneria buriramensis]REH33112.1 ribose transport system permease protein [Kutzneria buriramensis]
MTAATTAARLRRIAPIWVVLVLVLVGIVWRDPTFADPPTLLAFVKRSAPLAVLALGQLFVVISGELDLSVGALITACVVAAARLGEGDPSRTWWIILLVLGFGVVVGVVNGLITTMLRVPSFITTLGMMLVLGGAVFLWTGGSPTGALAENFRQYGREDIGPVPYAVVILLAIAVAAYFLLHRSRFGHQVFATGGGTRAAELSGVAVRRIRVTSFVLSGLLAAVSAILLAGFAGLSANAGQGYDFQSISAVVLGGAVLGGGRGGIGAALGGAFALQAMFTLLNLLGMAAPLRDTVQGLLIVAAVAFAAYRLRSNR